MIDITSISAMVAAVGVIIGVVFTVLQLRLNQSKTSCSGYSAKPLASNHWHRSIRGMGKILESGV